MLAEPVFALNSARVPSREDPSLPDDMDADSDGSEALPEDDPIDDLLDEIMRNGSSDNESDNDESDNDNSDNNKRDNNDNSNGNESCPKTDRASVGETDVERSKKLHLSAIPLTPSTQPEKGRIFKGFWCRGEDIARLADRTAWLSGTMITLFAIHCTTQARLHFGHNVYALSTTLMTDVECYQQAQIAQNSGRMLALVNGIGLSLKKVRALIISTRSPKY